MLNGQPWTPQGFNGTANLSIDYDATLNGRVFNISCYKILSSANEQNLILFGDSVQQAKKIWLPNKTVLGATFYNDVTGCNYIFSDPLVKIISGFFDIQKIDKTNNIFSGQFELVIQKNGCDTVKITNGRFDMKY